MKTVAAVLLSAVAAHAALDDRAELFAQEQWCYKNSDCRQNGDVAATCQANSCACSSAFANKNLGDFSSVVSRCYPKDRYVDFSLKFPASNSTDKFTCRQIGLSSATREALITSVENFAGGKAVASWFACGATNADNHPYFSVRLSVPSPCYQVGGFCSNLLAVAAGSDPASCRTRCEANAACTQWTITTTQCRLCSGTTTTQIGPRFGASMLLSGVRTCSDSLTRWPLYPTTTQHNRETDNLVAAVRDTITKDTLLRLVLGNQVAAIIGSSWSSKCTLSESQIIASPTSTGKVCRQFGCATGFVMRYNADFDTLTCTAVAGLPDAGSCLTNADCTWEAKKTICSNKKCVLPTLPAKIKGRTPANVNIDFCTRDADCRLYGDLASTCDYATGLGNWCKCSTGYQYALPHVPNTCHPAGTAVTLVTMAFTQTYKLQDFTFCPVTPQEKATLESLASIVYGGGVLENRARVWNVVTTCDASTSLVTVSGLVEMRASYLEFLNTETSPGDIVFRSLQAQKANSVRNVYRNGKVQSNNVNAWESIARFTPQQPFTLGAQYQCEAAHASASVMVGATCHTLQCVSNHTLTNHHVTGKVECIPQPEPLDGLGRKVSDFVSTSDDDDLLEDKHIASIVIGGVLTFAILALLVMYMSSGDAKDSEPLEDEDVKEEA